MSTTPTTLIPEQAVASIPFKEVVIKVRPSRKDFEVLLDGKKIENLASLNLYFYEDEYADAINLCIAIADPNPTAGQLSERKHWTLIPIPLQAQAEVTESSTSDQMQFKRCTPIPGLASRELKNKMAQIGCAH